MIYEMKSSHACDGELPDLSCCRPKLAKGSGHLEWLAPHKDFMVKWQHSGKDFSKPWGYQVLLHFTPRKRLNGALRVWQLHVPLLHDLSGS